MFIWGDEFIEPVEKFLAQSRCSVNIWWMSESSFQGTMFKILFPLLKAALWPYLFFSEGFPWVQHGSCREGLPSITVRWVCMPCPPLQPPSRRQHPESQHSVTPANSQIQVSCGLVSPLVLSRLRSQPRAHLFILMWRFCSDLSHDGILPSFV